MRLFCSSTVYLWTFLSYLTVVSLSVRIHNEKMEALTHPVSFQEISETVDFFIDQIIGKYTTEDGIAYEQLRNNSHYHNNSRFIKRALLDLNPSSVNEAEIRKTFFINIYNILALDSILTLPILPNSLDNVNGFEQAFGYKIGNHSLTLAAIKHGILRNNSPDPFDGTVYLKTENDLDLTVPKDRRIVFALFTGFRKDRFLFQSYEKETLDSVLNEITIKFCNQGVTLASESEIVIDEIFKTFLNDFAASEEGLLRWLSKCVTESTKKISLYFASIDQNILKYSFQKATPALNAIVLPASEGKVNVNVYIESLCTDVHDFFLQQLEPAWKVSGSLMNINIIPFGKGSVTPGNDREIFKFECQNGPQECLGNKVKSCVIAYYPNDLQIKMFTCSMINPELPENDRECSKKLGFPFAAIRECSNSLEGSKLLYENGLKTLQLKPKLFYIPTVTINGEYNSSLLRDSLKMFPEIICEKFVETNNKQRDITTPQGCKIKLEIYIEALNPDVQRFFTKQLVPTWKRVGNSIELKIIPFGNTTLEGDHGASENFAMKCPRGPIECYGNTVMGCIIELLPVFQQINLFHCMFSKKMIPFKGEECAVSEGIDWKPINACAEGSLGTKFVKENQVKTADLTPGLTSVPTITVNKIHNATFSDWASHDLLALVCDSFLIPNQQNTKAILPKGCPVRVEIYLEILCSDTNRFFLKVFYPTWKKISNLIDLHLIPFGKSNVWLNDDGSDYEFECHNGPLECQGNKVWSCIVEYLPVNLQVEFMACMLRDRNSPPAAGQTCAESLNIAWEPLSECYSTKEGSNLLFQNGLRTMNLKPTLFFVPTVTINGYYDADQLEKSLIMLGDQICEVYVGEFSYSEHTLSPKGCRLQVNVYFSASSKSSQSFIVGHLLPTWQKLGGESLSIEMIPLGSDLTTMTYFEAKRCQDDIKCSIDLMFICIASNYGFNSQLEFLKCLFEADTTFDAAKKCSRILGLSWDKISRCLRGPDALAILNKNIERALKLKPKFHYLPTVILNGFYNKNELKKSLEDFMGQVCNSFYDPTALTSKVWKPRGCPVTIELFLESLCPDTKWIFLQQVVPAWKKLSSVIDLKIIPFGKASAKLLNIEKDEYSFNCQNGPLECHGNKVMSCIVKHFNVHLQVKILECMLTKQFPAVEGRECAEQLGVSWDQMVTCIDKDASRLLYENGLTTEKVRPKIFFIPTVTVNGFYDKSLLRQAFKDLPGLVCEEYLKNDDNSITQNQIPEGCKVTITVFFETLDDKFKLFFSNEAEEIWKIYRKIIRFKFIPINYFKEQSNSTDVVHFKERSVSDFYLSKILSCLVQTQDTNAQLEFLACLMSLVDIKDRIQKCSNELKLNLKELESCAASKGSSLLAANEDSFRSHQLNNASSPFIMIDKTILKEQKQIRKLICRLFRGPKIQECDKYHL